jgi:hypothetical protein
MVLVVEAADVVTETVADGEPVVAGYAEDADSVHTTDYLGKRRFVKRSWGSSAGRRSVNYSEGGNIGWIQL